MTESKEYVISQLLNYTNAEECVTEVKNNRYHYVLSFSESIGFEWLDQQVQKCNESMLVSLELWEIHPPKAHGDYFTIEVREITRRAGIDDDQSGLTDFEQ